MKYLVILILLGGCTKYNEPVLEDFNIYWDIPTARESGSPLSLSEIKEYRIYTGDNFLVLHAIVTEPKYNFKGIGKVYITTLDQNGDESQYSNYLEFK